MQIIRRRGCARAGLVGNPSDGYNGKTISIAIGNYYAEVILYEWEDLEIVPSQEDHSRFRSIHDLSKDVDLHGYYGGIRLVKATIKKFAEYCRERYTLHDRNFSIRYESNIPRQVGLAGSSAIITATLRALMDFYEVKIPPYLQASLVLNVETDELGIVAGLQDRVIQSYGGVVYMDFSKSEMKVDEETGLEYGHYEVMDPSLLPPLYIAYSEEVGEPTDVRHIPLRARYEAGEPDVVAAMEKFAELTVQAKEAIEQGDVDRLSDLLDENLDTRRSICELHEKHVAMVETARSVGVSAKFAGSGGAIIGVCKDEETFQRLKSAMKKIKCEVFRPHVA